MIKEMILRTPLIAFEQNPLSSGGRIFLKPENLQTFGSYKIRGIQSAIQNAPKSILSRGLSTASAGNMAQAVAFVARRLDVPCQIYVPDTAPEIKIAAIKKLGANLIELPFAQVWEMVRHPPKEVEGLFIHPVFTPGLLEGYGTIAKELLTDRPTLDAVVIPFGVGGLTLGVARALKSLKPNILIYACEPETAAPLKKSLQMGQATQVIRVPSYVDAIGTPEVLQKVFVEVRDLVTDSLVVSLAETTRALRSLALDRKLVCEGAAAVGFAAGLQLAAKNPEMEIACILTGGNISPELLLRILESKRD